MSKINKTKAVMLQAYNDNLIRAILGLKVEEVELPELKADEVLIKMEATTCNPSDIAFLRGGYNIVKPLPAIPGFEGSGTVIKAGGEADEYLNKRVCCFSQVLKSGTWAYHFVAQKQDCIILKDGVDFEQAACFSINPITAYGLFEMVARKNCKAIIQNAAGGQVAEFIRVLAKKNSVDVINVVRKEEQVSNLTAKGEKYVLNSTVDDFYQKLKKLSGSLNADLAIDAVGGDQSGILMKAIPENSSLVLYGGLSGTAVSGIDPLEIIFKGKSIIGFNLNDWIASKGQDELKAITDGLQEMIINGTIKTEIQARFHINDVVKGVRTYIKYMSGGKILFHTKS